MLNNSFDKISVQDIAESATVNRATFYDHYTDKFSLLDAMVAGGFHQLLQERSVRYDGTCASAAAPVILATCDYLRQFHSSASCEHQSAFEPLIEAAITKSIRRVLMEGIQKEGSLAGFPPEMVASTASWAIYGAVKAWFSASKRPPAEEIVPVILRLVLPILQSASPVVSS